MLNSMQRSLKVFTFKSMILSGVMLSLSILLFLIYWTTSLEIVLTVSVLLAAVIILKHIYDLSAVKPHIRPVCYNLNGGYYPKIALENCGPGHAKNIRVEVYVDLERTNYAIRNETFIAYSGPSFLPFTEDHASRTGEYIYRGDRDIMITGNKVFKIIYENDRGYREHTIWKCENRDFHRVSGL